MSVHRFTTVRKAYVYYSVSVKKEERIRISEFTMLPHDDNQLDHSSERWEVQSQGNTETETFLHSCVDSAGLYAAMVESGRVNDQCIFPGDGLR